MAQPLFPNGPIEDPVDAFKPPAKDRPDVEVSDDDQVNWALKQIASARSRVATWAKQARECDRFAAGEHFTEADKRFLEEEGRMHAVFNSAQKWLRFIPGVVRQSQTEIVFAPRDVHSDQQGTASDLVSKGVKWVLDGCAGEDERIIAFTDMVRRGMGWTQVNLNRGHDVSGIIELARVDGMEMLWDTDAEKQNLTDANWIARERQVPKKEAERRWPKFKDIIAANVGSLKSEDGMGAENTSTLLNEKEAIPSENVPSVKPGKVKVTEFQWREEVPGVYFYDPFDDKDDWLSEKEFEAYRKKYQRLAAVMRSKAMDPDAPYTPEERQAKLALPEDLEHDRVLMWQYRSMLIIGRTAVAKTEKLPGQRFTYNCMTGTWDDTKKIWYGHFSILLDPQRYATKYANQVMDIIARSAKGGIFIEADAVDNPVVFEDEYSRVGGVSVLNSGAISGGKLKEKPPVSLPQGSVEMFKVCNDLMTAVTGINPEVQMGMGGADQPAMTMRQRQSAGLLLLSQEFSSLDRYMIQEAKTIFDFLRLIADNRWIRVGGPYDSQALQLIKEPFFMEYDVLLDEGTRDPEVRRLIWGDLMVMAPMLQKAGLWIDKFWDYSRLPASERAEIKKAMAAQREQKAKMAQQGISDGGRGKPTSITEVKAREAEIKSRVALNEAKAAKLMSEAKGTQGQQMLDAIINGSKMGLDVAKEQGAMRRDQQKANLDMEVAGRKAQLEERKQQMETGRAAMGAGMDVFKMMAQHALKPEGGEE